ncbi:hypothetical protein PVK06_046565 [Gossypium arboreum]|uniref:Secreted protein n=1 Tax=Gossypium arboreum TaxID=29729 RepID=A0ABR0MBC7_GOSAR|nr:hypothetical protein PVK06_046565 [Gossypium arboreum]
MNVCFELLSVSWVLVSLGVILHQNCTRYIPKKQKIGFRKKPKKLSVDATLVCAWSCGWPCARHDRVSDEGVAVLKT